MISIQPPTDTERALIRQAIQDGDAETMSVFENVDGTVACNVAGVFFDMGSYADVFRTLASIMEGDA